MKLWRPQTVNFILLGVVLVLVGLVALFMVNNFQPTTRVLIGSGAFDVHVADTEAKRIKGLSGTNKLGVNEGLLMVFVGDDKWPIWMKDMNYPIDIIWIDSNYKIVHIVRNAPIETPEKRYVPTSNARYVLELPAGSVANSGIKVGTKASFVVEEANVEP